MENTIAEKVSCLIIRSGPAGYTAAIYAARANIKTIAAMNVEVNMLINNAGIGSTLFFAEGSADLYERQIKLNVLATTLITHFFLEMLKRHKRAYILNVGSMASFFCLPKKNVYGATKSFIYHFSRSLIKELKKSHYSWQT